MDFFSPDRSRMVREVGFGYACYQGRGPVPAQGEYNYDNMGLVPSAEMAQSWLQGDPGVSPRKIVPPRWPV